MVVTTWVKDKKHPLFNFWFFPHYIHMYSEINLIKRLKYVNQVWQIRCDYQSYPKNWSQSSDLEIFLVKQMSPVTCQNVFGWLIWQQVWRNQVFLSINMLCAPTSLPSPKPNHPFMNGQWKLGFYSHSFSRFSSFGYLSRAPNPSKSSRQTNPATSDLKKGQDNLIIKHFTSVRLV